MYNTRARAVRNIYNNKGRAYTTLASRAVSRSVRRCVLYPARLPRAQQPNSPTAQQPNSPTAQQPNNPPAQQPACPTTRLPNSPTAQQPTPRLPDSPAPRPRPRPRPRAPALTPQRAPTQPAPTRPPCLVQPPRPAHPRHPRQFRQAARTTARPRGASRGGGWGAALPSGRGARGFGRRGRSLGLPP